ncbi:MAG: hypothetical protein B7Z73_09005 [Planctomycetia bacterium 21-64-5]|nr:MAG: hypothetical protein B7Z73_09005 [Planctomycetia bacterium 21-64-5]
MPFFDHQAMGDDLNEIVIGGKKPTQVSYYEEDTLLANYMPGPVGHRSCLIAGTPSSRSTT